MVLNEWKQKVGHGLFIHVFAEGWEASWNQENRLKFYLCSLNLSETCPVTDWVFKSSWTACRHNRTDFWLTSVQCGSSVGAEWDVWIFVACRRLEHLTPYLICLAIFAFWSLVMRNVSISHRSSQGCHWIPWIDVSLLCHLVRLSWHSCSDRGWECETALGVNWENFPLRGGGWGDSSGRENQQCSFE